MSGWIKLYRKSLNHWLYNENRPHTRREAWEDMLLLCNHDNEKILIQGEIINCNRGQSVTSLKSWAKQFKWTIQKVRTFLKMLENDSMIEVEGLRKSTRITICNYEVYQNNQQADNKEITSKQQADNKEITTNKKIKNDKKKRNNISLLSQVDESTLDHKTKKYYQVAISFYELIKSNLKELNISNSEIEKAKYKTWIEPIRLLIEKDGRTIEEFREIFQFLQKDDFWKEQIRSTAKLRKKNKEDISYFEVLLTKSRNEQKQKEKRESSEQEKQSGVSDDYRKSILNRLLNPQNSEAT
jgi:hypothetical protein